MVYMYCICIIVLLVVVVVFCLTLVHVIVSFVSVLVCQWTRAADNRQCDSLLLGSSSDEKGNVFLKLFIFSYLVPNNDNSITNRINIKSLILALFNILRHTPL